MIIDINSKEVVNFALKLERMSKSALPVAVRQTLNSAAFDVKQKTMPAAAKGAFIERKPNFFKANSKASQASGFNVNSMVATVGFIPFSGTNKAVDDLEQQEHGGDIKGRSFIGIADARVSKSTSRQIRANARISDLKKRIVNANRGNGRSAKEKYIRSAIHAGPGGIILGNKLSQKGTRFLYRIKSLKKVKGRTIVKTDLLYAYQKNKAVKPKATHFMEQASLKSAGIMQRKFIEHAQRAINKVR